MNSYWILIFFTGFGQLQDTVSIRFETQIECEDALSVLTEHFYPPGWFSSGHTDQNLCLEIPKSKVKN